MQPLLEQVIKGNFMLLAVSFLTLAAVEMSCCAQIAKRGLNVTVENYRKNRSLQDGLCHLVQYIGCLSVFLPKTFLLLACSWERKGHLRLEVWAEVALTVCGGLVHVSTQRGSSKSYVGDAK